MLRALLVIGMGLLSLLCMGCGGDGSPAQAAAEQSAAGQPAAEARQSEDKAGTGSRALVVYFSPTGNTAQVAARIAEAAGADTFEIKAAQPYTPADLNYNDESTRATREQKGGTARPAMETPAPDMSQYDTVYLGYPIWWGRAPMILFTFVEESNLSGKTVIPFVTSASSDIGGSAEELKARCSAQTAWKPGRRFSASASAGEIEAWLALGK